MSSCSKTGMQRMKRDIIPPPSADIQLSIDQFYEIIRMDRAVRR